MTQLTITDKLRNLNDDIRSSDLQSESDLDSIRNSCDVLGFIHTNKAKYSLMSSQVRYRYFRTIILCSGSVTENTKQLLLLIGCHEGEG